MKPGDKVHYLPRHGAKENGIVKSVSPDGDRIFVVYKCNEDWDNYRDYTGCSTAPEDLHKGWVDENGKLLKDTID